MSDLEQAENSIEEATKLVKRAEKAMALIESPNFVEIIEQGYFKDEASRLVLLYGDGIQDDETRRKIERDMHGIGSLMQFLRNIMRSGAQGERDLIAAQHEREDILAEMAEMKARGEEAPTDFDSDYAGNLGT